MSFAKTETLLNSNWLAFGDIRGHFEPCGCDPSTDLGGIDRLDAYIQRERKINVSSPILFSVGNNFSLEYSSLATKKNEAIKKALFVLRPDASLWNETENSYLGTKFKSLVENYFVTNQSKNMSESLKLPSFFKFPAANVLVLGFVEPVTVQTVEYDLDIERFLNKAAAIRKDSPSFSSVLLFSGSDQTLLEILSRTQFDEVIVANRHPLDQKFDDFQRRDEKKLNLTVNKQNVRVVPLGAQGVLRSNALAKLEPPKSLTTLFSLSQKQVSSKPAVPVFGAFHGVAWLSADMGTSSTSGIVQAIAEYRQDSSNQMKSLIESRVLDLKTSEFVGSDSCSGCHESAFEVWKNSKHGKALDTIYRVNRQNDPECVSCHVVGFDKKGGFVSREHTIHLQHVGCESCHGPRKLHVKNPTIKGDATKAKDSCKSCHTPPHSPKYNYDSYWKLIEHK